MLLFDDFFFIFNYNILFIAQALSHSNSDVKQYIPKVCMYIGQRVEKPKSDFLQLIVPMLVCGVKGTNTIIKSNCELALISVLKLADGHRSVDEVNFLFTRLLNLGVIISRSCIYGIKILYANYIENI